MCVFFPTKVPPDLNTRNKASFRKWIFPIGPLRTTKYRFLLRTFRTGYFPEPSIVWGACDGRSSAKKINKKAQYSPIPKMNTFRSLVIDESSCNKVHGQIQLSDRPFLNFRASKSGYRRDFCGPGTPCDGFWSSKLWKSRPGLWCLWCCKFLFEEQDFRNQNETSVSHLIVNDIWLSAENWSLWARVTFLKKFW